MSRPLTHFNGLTPSEAELLAILAEEAGEVVQAIGKILRHGYDSHNPHDPKPNPATGIGATNRFQLEREIGDFDAVCALLVEAKSVDPTHISNASGTKRRKLKQWTHHQGEGSGL